MRPVPRQIRILRQGFPDRPAFDTAVSAAVMRRTGRGELTETLRLSVPGPMVAFGRQDVIEPGYRRAVAAARAGGYEAIERLAGGRAAVFHTRTLSFSWAIPTPDSRLHITKRFDELAAIMVAAFRRLGVDARVGEVPGEYCPGAHSVNAAGARKLMGVGQRLVSGAAHVGGVVVVDGSSEVRAILVPVYEALGLAWDPATAGSIADEVGPVSVDEVAAAILSEFGSRYELLPAGFDPDTLAYAADLEPDHRSPA